MLEKVGIQVKVLRMRDAKDPDEFLHKHGADAFRVLLEESSNRVEYQLDAIGRKYDISDDDQKVKYLQECAELISSLGSSVQREVYTGRVAEKASISQDAMKLEVNRAYKRRIAREKKKQEQVDLAPAQALQPKSRTIRYDNMKSAMAEETVIATVMKAPAMLEEICSLEPDCFSSPLLREVYRQLRTRYNQHLEVSAAVLEGFDPEEMSHITAVMHRHQGPANEAALLDCAGIIRQEHAKASFSGEDALLALQKSMKERKGIDG
jgi:DNA primase